MSTPSTQKALVVEKKYGDFVLKSVPVPKPAPEEVIVKIEAVGLNPVDWIIQKSSLFLENYPATLGYDIAGEVVELGEKVTNVAKGDKVVFEGSYVNEHDIAGFQQYTRAKVHHLAKIPSNISSVEAATLPVGLITAYVGLYHSSPHGAGYVAPLTTEGVGKYSDNPIVVLGGATSVGQYVIQLARLSGFSPIITTASLHHADFLKSLGATHVLDRSLTQDALKNAILDITSAPVKLVYTPVSSPESQKDAVDILAPGGQIVLTLPPVVESTEEKTVFMVSGWAHLDHNTEFIKDFYAKLNEWLKEGVIKPNRPDVLPGGLNGIVGGLQRLEEYKVSGVKLVALPQETS